MSEMPDPHDLIEVSPLEAARDVRHDPYAALRIANYRSYLTGNLLSTVGANMQTVAVGWEVYERTGVAMALGWVGLVQALPIMLLALPAGQLADRWNRRRMVMGSLLLMGGCSLGLAFVSWTQGPVGWIYALLVLGSVGRAFVWPASQAMMTGLVPREAFSNAVTWKGSVYHFACVAGPALGGLMIGMQKTATWVYLVDATVTLSNVIFVYRIDAIEPLRMESEATLKNLFAGFRFVWKTRVILAAITLDLFAVLLGGAVALLPIYAKDILRVGPTGLGWLCAAPAAGALGMGILLSYLPPMKHAGKALLYAVAVFGIVTIIFGFSHWFWLSLLMLLIGGAADMISVVVRHSLVQLRTPDEMRGRVSAVNSVFISASNELGGFESGTVAHFFGPVISVVSGGIGTLIVVALAIGIWPEIKKLGSLNDFGNERA